MAEGRRADPHDRDGRRGRPRRSSAPTSARLVDAGVAGLGFGLGFAHEKTPRALVAEAGKHGFPLFEVPYPVPFIAITEAVFTRVVAEQYDTLQRAVDAEHVLTRAVLEGAGVEGVARSLADVVRRLGAAARPARHAARGDRPRRGGARASGSGTRCAARGPRRRRSPSRWSTRGTTSGSQPVGAQGRIEAFLAVGKPEQPTPARPDRRRARAQPVRDRAREVARGRRGRAPAAGGLPRRARPRGACRRPTPARGLARFGFARDARVFVVAIEPVDGRDRAEPPRARGDRALFAPRRRVPDLRAAPSGICDPAPGERCARTRRSSSRGSASASMWSCASGPAAPSTPGRSGDRSARPGTRCRSAGSRDGSTPGSNSSAPTGCCSR